MSVDEMIVRMEELQKHLQTALVLIEKLQWIKCSERLPSENGKYLIYHTKGKFGRFEEGIKIWTWRLSTNPKYKGTGRGFWGNCDIFFRNRITHWIPLPPPPKEIG